MRYNEWKEVMLDDVISFNPRESLKKGTVAKKIGMDKLEPFNREIQGYEVTEFKSGTKFRNGDTLLARITPCLENGKTAQVRILDKNEVAFGSTEFIVMREKANKTINDFIYYLAISEDFRNIAIKSMTGTSGRQRVQKDVLKKAVMKLPPLEEQKAIAHILSTLDEKIEVNNKINKKLEEMAQAIFKHWFIDFEFPNENGEPYKSSGGEMVESELGMIPKGWEVRTIKEIALNGNVICGKTPSTKKKENYGRYMPFITIPDMHNKVFVTVTERYLSKLGVESQNNKTLPPNSICVSCIATPGLVTLTTEKSQTNQQINSFQCKEGISYYYMYLNLSNRSEEIRTLGAGGSTTLNLNKTQFSKIKVIIPPKDIMFKFHNKVTPMFELIKQKDFENITLSKIRDSILPKLMSGEIRVPLDN